MTEGGVLLPTGLYCPDTTQTFRRKTRTIQIGNVKVGSDHPIVKQTMTTSDTRDVNATVNEIMRCADAGAEMVRITVQGMQEAKACQEIKNKLLQSGYTTPICRYPLRAKSRDDGGGLLGQDSSQPGQLCRWQKEI